MNLTSLDWIVLVLTGLAAWKGFKKGLIRELAGLLGLLVAAWLAWKFMGNLGTTLQRWMEGSLPAIPLISFLILFTSLIAAFGLLARFATRLLDMTIVLGLMNRIGGSCVAVIQVLLVMMVLIWLADRTQLISPETRQQSIVYPVLSKAGPVLVEISATFFPQSESWMEVLTEKVQALKEEE